MGKILVAATILKFYSSLLPLFMNSQKVLGKVWQRIPVPAYPYIFFYSITHPNFHNFIQGQPTVFSKSTHHRELFSLASLHHQPSQHHKLTTSSYFSPTCSLLTPIVTTGSIFCRYPFFFLFYLSLLQYNHY